MRHVSINFNKLLLKDQTYWAEKPAPPWFEGTEFMHDHFVKILKTFIIVFMDPTRQPITILVTACQRSGSRSKSRQWRRRQGETGTGLNVGQCKYLWEFTKYLCKHFNFTKLSRCKIMRLHSKPPSWHWEKAGYTIERQKHTHTHAIKIPD